MVTYDFWPNETQLVINRETYTIFDMLGDVGGAAELIWFVLSSFISVLSSQKLTAMAGDRMYTTKKSKL